MVTDSWPITAQSGLNTLRLVAGEICTHYWVRRIEIVGCEETTPHLGDPSFADLLKQAREAYSHGQSLGKDKQYKEAEKCFELSRVTYNKVPGTSEDQADCLDRIAWTLKKQGHHEQSLDTRLKACDLYATITGAETDLSDCLYYAGQTYQTIGDSQLAIAMFERAHTLSRSLPGGRKTCARALFRKGMALSSVEDFEPALNAFKRANDLYSSLPGSASETYLCLVDIARTLDALDRRDEAQSAYLEALAALASLYEIPVDINDFEPSHRDVAVETIRELFSAKIQDEIRFSDETLQSLISSARISAATAERSQAESLAMREDMLGKSSVYPAETIIVSLVQAALAESLRSLGQHSNSLALQKTSREIVSKHKSLPFLQAVVIQEEAASEQALGNLTKALSLYDQAHAIYSGTTGSDLEQGQCLESIGWVLNAQGKHHEAIETFSRALDAYLIAGIGTIATADYLMAVGVCEKDLGNPEIALASQETAMRIYKDLEPESYDKDQALFNIGYTYAALGDCEKAAQAFFEAAQHRCDLLFENFPLLTETEKLSAQHSGISYDPSYFYSLVVGTTGCPSDAQRQGFEIALMFKAVIPEAMRNERFFSRNQTGWEADFTALNQMRRQLARLLFAEHTVDKSSNTAFAELEDRIKTIETKLMRASPRNLDEIPLHRIDSSSIVLGEDEVLLEYVRYQKYRFSGSYPPNRWQGERYGLFVLSESEVHTFDLGPAEEIDRAVQEFRNVLNEPTRHGPLRRWPDSFDEKRAYEVATKLRDLVITPSTGLLANRNRVYIAPEGDLSLIPFEALPTLEEAEDLRYFGEDHEVVVLTSGRSLAAVDSSTQEQDQWVPFDNKGESYSVVLVGDPEFNKHGLMVMSAYPLKPPPDKNNQESAALLAPSRSPGEEPHTLSTNLNGRNASSFAVIEEQIRTNFGESVVVLNEIDVSEEPLFELKGPRILQFVTHGLFIADDAASNSVLDAVRQELLRNPMLRSMLILPAAKKGALDSLLHSPEVLATTGEALETLSSVDVDDGLLTAYEVAGLDLAGTELVVLTACESGLGVPQTGIGVSGLRQAFHLAGAKAVIMSMWKVPATESLRQLKTFYEEWLSGKPKFDAFRASQMESLTRARELRECGHPFYWAGFVFAGRP